MSKQDSSPIIEVFLGVCLVLATVFVIWVVYIAGRGIVRSFHQTEAQKQAQQAQIDKQNAEWAIDPTNPKVIAKKCMDMGGIPTFSAWDGRVTSCKGADQKNVNIEFNQ